MAVLEPPLPMAPAPSMLVPGAPCGLGNAGAVLPATLPSLVPVRLRTPSGKSAVFYAAAGNALGVPAANAIASAGAVVHPGPNAHEAQQLPRSAMLECPRGGMSDPSTLHDCPVPDVVPQSPYHGVVDRPTLERDGTHDANMVHDCAQAEAAIRPNSGSSWSERSPSAEHLTAADKGSVAPLVDGQGDCRAVKESEWQDDGEADPAALHSRDGEENITFGDCANSDLHENGMFCGAEPHDAELRIGDIVYRQGQLAAVVHIEREFFPPSYVVRVAQTGCEVSCERDHLSLAFSAPSPNAEQQQQQHEQQQQQHQQHHQLQQQLGSISPAAFADMVQMQQQQCQLQHQNGSISHASFADMVQIQYYQNQLLQQIDPRILEQHVLSAQHTQDMVQGHGAHPLQHWPGFNEVREAPAVHPLGQHGDLSHGPSGELDPDDMYRLYQLRMAHEAGPPATSSSFADAAQMQHVMRSAHSDEGHTGSGMPAAGRVKNHALDALSEALDRAEIGMIMGGKHGPSSARSLEDGYNFALPNAGQSSSMPSSTNYALQAASRALGVADSGLPMSSRFHNPTDMDDFSSKLDPSNFPIGGSSSTNYALQAASQALGTIESFPKPQSKGSLPLACDDILAEGGLAVKTSKLATSRSPVGGMISAGAVDRTRRGDEHELTSDIVLGRHTGDEHLDLSQEPVHSMMRKGSVAADAPPLIAPPLAPLEHPHAEQGSEPSSPRQFPSSCPSRHQISPIERSGDDEDEELELMARMEMEQDEIVNFRQLDRVSTKSPSYSSNALTPTPPPAPPLHSARHWPPSGGRYRPPSAGRRAPSVEAVARAVIAGSTIYEPSRPRYDPQLVNKQKLEKRDSLLNYVLSDDAARPVGSTGHAGCRTQVPSRSRSKTTVSTTAGVRSRSMPPAPAASSSTTFASYNAPSHNKFSQASMPQRPPRQPDLWAPSTFREGSTGPKQLGQDWRSPKLASLNLPSLRSGGSGTPRTSQNPRPAPYMPTGLHSSGSQSARSCRSAAKKCVALHS